MKRELMESCNGTSVNSSPTTYKRQRMDFQSEGRSMKAEQLEEITNVPPPQNFPIVRQHSAAKRRALDRDFATKLASITLTSSDLCRLDAMFGGAEDADQLEQFSRAVSGCLCRVRRHAVGQHSDVIAVISAVVGPVDLHQMAFPRRRIFIFLLGYFDFDQFTDHKPDLVDYGPWMADMDLQSVPLPSDEFIEQKVQMLCSLLTDSLAQHHHQQQHHDVHHRQNVKMERLERAEETTTSSSSRRTTNHVNHYGHAENDGDDDDDDDVHVLELDTASSTVKTELSTADDDEDEQQPDHEQHGHDSDDSGHEEEEDGDQPPVTMLVHSTEMLRRVRFLLSALNRLANIEQVADCLVGCMMVCRVKNSSDGGGAGSSNKNNSETVIVDEIMRVDHAKVMFKHTPSALHHVNDLEDCEITDKTFRDWVDKLAKWGESLPLFSLYRGRRSALYARLKLLKNSQKVSRNQKRKQLKRKKEEKQQQQEGANNSSGSSKQLKTTTKKHRLPSKALVAAAPQQQHQRKMPTPPTTSSGSVVGQPLLSQQFHDDPLYIEQFNQIFVFPKQLVQLHQLGQEVFERVVVGLFVKVRNSKAGLAQIKRVTWDGRPYQFFGQDLTALLHYDHLQPCTIKSIPSFKHIHKLGLVMKYLRNQQQTPALKLELPSADFVMRKSQQLRTMLKRTKPKFD